MEIEAAIIKKRNIQSLVLTFIENDDDDENFQAFTKFIEDNNISKNQEDLRDLLYMILMISNDHHRENNFFGKIMQILKYLLPSIKIHFTDFEFFKIYQSNNIIIINLIHNKMIVLERNMLDSMCSYQMIKSFENQSNYFGNGESQHDPYQLLLQYYYSQSNNDTEGQENIISQINDIFNIDLETFQSLCQQGENDNYICKLIRQDLLNEFISYINEKKFDLNSKVPSSLFESNDILRYFQPTLIDYSAFYGSIKIFKYLKMNRVNIEPPLMIFAVHSLNSEMIHLVEDNREEYESATIPDKNTFKITFGFKRSNTYDPIDPFCESIKCHHNDLANYFEQTLLKTNSEKVQKAISVSFNYEFLPTDLNEFLTMQEYERMKPSFHTLNDKYDIFMSFHFLTKITIPESVTKILENSFSGFKSLKEVVLPSKITTIGDSAFNSCSALEEITIPSSVKSIGSLTFANCTSLSKVTILSALKTIGKNCFQYCSSLVNINLPSSITMIDNLLFQDCSSLKEIQIPSSVTIINDFAFKNCTSLIKIDLPNSLESINKGAFANCSSLKEISIPSTVKNIGIENTGRMYYYDNEISNDGVFKGCSSLIEITIPNCVKNIKNYTFEGCSSLERVKFENSKSCLNSIGENAFKGCKSLIEIDIPSTVTIMKNGCFEGCSSLKQIKIPSSVKYVNERCFKGCSSLKELPIHPSITYISVSAFEQCSSLTQVEVPSSVKDIASFAFCGCSSIQKVIIHSNITIINKSVFNGCSSLVDFTIPPSVTDIGENGFRGCSSLKQITIPSTLTRIEGNCFEGCSSFKQITIPSSVTSIGSCSFKDCSSITEITIPSSVKAIESSAFKGCSSLKQIEIPNLITEIEDNCFEGCSSLVQIKLPSSLSLIGDFVFRNCSSLEQLTIPSSVTKIGKNCFEGCLKLNELIIPSSVSELNEFFFGNCSSLVHFTIPSSITSIKYGAFKGCTLLSEVIIPSSVTTIEDNVFNGCKSLKKISIPSSITKINDFLFANCSSLSEVEIPSTTTEIGCFSFYNCSSLTKISIPLTIKKIGDFAFSGCKLLSSTNFPFQVPIDSIEFKRKENQSTNEKESIESYLKSRKEIYQTFLNYLESQDDKIEDFINIIQFIDERNLAKNEFDLIELLNILSKLSNYHIRNPHLIKKVEKILSILKEEIKEQLTNNKICQIFNENKRITLFLIEKDILNVNQSVLNKVLLNEYKEYDKYFMPEIMKYKNESKIDLNEIDTNSFEEKRKIGENDSEVCQIIRSDSLDEFVSFISNKQKEIKENNNDTLFIPDSIYETNQSFYRTLIEYAAFCGSIKIFKYLLNKEKIQEQDSLTLWKCAIHGNNLNIIKMLESKEIIPMKENTEKTILHELMNRNFNPNECFIKAIKCHHFEIANYIEKNYEITTDYVTALESYNFNFIEKYYKFYEGENPTILHDLCQFDFPRFAQVLIDNENIDLDQLENQKEIKREHFSSSNNKDEIVSQAMETCQEILSYFIDVKNAKIEFNIQSLNMAINNEDIELVKMILCQSNIDLNEIYNDQFYIGDKYCDSISPLILAVSKQNVKIVKTLLKYPSIDVNLSVVPDGSRTTEWTALHTAILFENAQIVQILLNCNDIDVNIIANFDETTYRFYDWSNDGHFDHYFTALHEAIELNNVEIVKLLLGHPYIDVNKIEIYDTYCYKYKNSFRRVKQTALCRAIQKGNPEMVRLLLNHPQIDVNKGAVLIPEASDDTYDENIEDVDDENAIRKTPLQFAMAFKNEEILNLLFNRNDIDKSTLDDENEMNDAFAFIERINE